MQTTTIFFSPTGGTRKVAETLASAIGVNSQSIDLCSQQFGETVIAGDRVAVVAVPSYYGRIPRLCAERLRKIKGNGNKAVLVAVYGNRAFEDTLVELEDILVENGFQLIAAVAAIAQHSIAGTVAHNRPDKNDISVLNDFAVRIKEKISSQNLSRPQIPGNRPYREIPSGGVPIETNDCCECGTCAPLCPSGAISNDRPSEISADICIGCMRCVQVCPVQARVIPAAVVNKVTMMLNQVCPTPKKAELYL